MNSIDVINAVTSINEEIFEDERSGGHICLTYSTNGFGEFVEFGDLRLWDWDEDTRIFSEEDDEYEEIEVCLRRMLAEEIAKISAIASSLFSSEAS